MAAFRSAAPWLGKKHLAHPIQARGASCRRTSSGCPRRAAFAADRIPASRASWSGHELARRKYTFPFPRRAGHAQHFRRPGESHGRVVDRTVELTHLKGNRSAIVERFRQDDDSNFYLRVPVWKLPTLIISGTKDRLVPPENACNFHRESADKTNWLCSTASAMLQRRRTQARSVQRGQEILKTGWMPDPLLARPLPCSLCERAELVLRRAGRFLIQRDADAVVLRHRALLDRDGHVADKREIGDRVLSA